jgi:hypothetical protein
LLPPPESKSDDLTQTTLYGYLWEYHVQNKQPRLNWPFVFFSNKEVSEYIYFAVTAFSQCKWLSTLKRDRIRHLKRIFWRKRASIQCGCICLLCSLQQCFIRQLLLRIWRKELLFYRFWNGFLYGTSLLDGVLPCMVVYRLYLFWCRYTPKLLHVQFDSLIIWEDVYISEVSYPLY